METETALTTGTTGTAGSGTPATTVQSETSTGSQSADTSGSTNTAPSWNGELSSLDEQEWYKRLPDDIKPHVRAGHEAKLKTYDQGYQSKFRGLADERKSWEQKLADERTQLREERAHFERLLYGEEDPAAAVKADLEQKLGELQTKHDALAKQQQEREEAENKRAADGVHDYIKAQAEDIYSDDEAFEMCIGLLVQGIPPEKALKMVRATMTVAEEPPRSVRAMGDDAGSSNSRTSTPKTWAEAVKEEKRILTVRG